MGFIGELPDEDMEYYFPYNVFAPLDFISDFIVWIFSVVGLFNLIKVGDPLLPVPNPTRLSYQVFEDFVGDQPETCTVCLCELQGGGGGGGGGGDEAMRLKKCKHGFHHGCIGRWTDHGNISCPVCRTPYYDHDQKKQECNNSHWEAFDGFGGEQEPCSGSNSEE